MESKRLNERHDGEFPPHSRLFIMCEKAVTAEKIRDAFSKFGTIQEVKVPTDHNTGEPKGVVYVQFSKTSEAAQALEEMYFKVLPDCQRPLKIMVAASRSDIQSSDYDEEQYKRLFICSESATEEKLHSDFSQYGHIESIVILRRKSTGDARGFAYIKFRKFTEAANAYEQCASRYKAVFASPKSRKDKRSNENSFESSINQLASSSSHPPSLLTLMNTRPEGYTKVHFMCCPYLSHRQVSMIFDLIPGMTHCNYFVDPMYNHGKGMVAYSNPVSASYAVDKLNRFEYPPGMKIFVKPDMSRFDDNMPHYTEIPHAVNNLRRAITSTSNSKSPDLAQLSEAIAEASKLIKAVTGAADDHTTDDLNYCSVRLPPPQPLAHIDSPLAKRCFLVCKPSPPSSTVLRDVFCRFGNLIDVYTLANKTVGYARYAAAESAEQAIKTLHGAQICGIRIKVLEADEEAPPKRRRYD